MNLIWEGRIAGNVFVKIETSGKVHCEHGITLAMLVDGVAKASCQVKIWERNNDPENENEEDAGVRNVERKTVSAQVTEYKMRNSKLDMQMSMLSTSSLPSMATPNEFDYDSIADNGYMITSRRYIV